MFLVKFRLVSTRSVTFVGPTDPWKESAFILLAEQMKIDKATEECAKCRQDKINILAEQMKLEKATEESRQEKIIDK